MSLNKKLRTCILTFMLLISSFTFIFVNSDTVKAEDPFGDLFGDDFELEEIYQLIQAYKLMLGPVLFPHPYKVVGAYSINETMNITGDVLFNLFFSFTEIQQFGERFQDQINVSLHQYNFNDGSISEIENANLTIQLDPESSGDVIQLQDDVVLENINHTLYAGDYLLISIEIIQSKKLIYDFVEKAYEKTLRPLIEKLANLLNNTEDPTISEFGGAIKKFISIIETAGIGAEEIAYLFNTITSSSFYYGSDSYKSSVFIPLSNSENNKTLYFHNMYHELDGFGFGNIKTVDETEPSSSTDNMWPPISSNSESETGGSEIFSWFAIWLFHNFELVISAEEDIISYYLTSENKLVTDKPTESSPSRFILKKDTPVTWENMSINRNRIIKNATATLYMYFPKIMFLRKITVSVTLFDVTEEKAVATVEKQLDRTKLFELIFRRSNSPTLFNFNKATGEELRFDHTYSLIVTASGGPLFTLRKTNLLCDSVDYPSSVTFKFKETDHINITNDLETKYVIPGGSTEFELNIESEYSDTIDIEVIPIDTGSLVNWSIEFPDSVEINGGEKETVKVIVTSLDDTEAAYKQNINLLFIVTGNTGKDIAEAKVKVGKEAVDYDIEVDIPARKEIKHGTSGTYVFRIKNNNTGYMEDEYIITATSEHDWSLEVDYDDEAYIDVGEELIVNVTVFVPEYTEISSDKLTLTITSIRSEDYSKDITVVVDVTTTVILPNILENIYHFFESTAESLGLDEVLGDYAAAFLMVIVILIIIIFLIVIIYLIRLKYVDIVCLDRIKEIGPDDKAEFDLEIQNPYKQKLTYELRTVVNSDPESWEISLDTESIIVESKEKQAIKLIVEPTDFVKQDDWVEVKIIAKAVDKKKEATISTVTSIKDAKPDARLIGVFHWPKVFKKGQRIVTSFRVENRGKVSANNVSVILYVNGEEKNKVEDITIPRGGYAEIEMPWIAVKGKNKVSIVVK